MFEQNEKNIYSFYKVLQTIDTLCAEVKADITSEEYTMVKDNFIQSMDNDFNTAGALSHLFNYFKMISKCIDAKEIQKLANIKQGIVDTYKILGMFEQKPELVINQIKEKYLTLAGKDVNAIEELISKRNELKKDKQYEEADRIRKELEESGIAIKDTKDGVEWDIKFEIK
jgi:cysteinyl-tRNA synthetase